MAVTAAELATIVEDLRGRLAGARIRAVHGPRPHEIVLRLRAEEGDLRLLLSLHPRRARCHLLEVPRTNPPEPPALVMSLRPALQNARIEDVVAVPGDRVVRIAVRRGAAPGVLVAELFRGRPALALLDGEGTVIVSTRGELSAGRTARPGETYVPPAPPEDAASERAPGDPAAVHAAVAAREEAEEERQVLEDARRARLRETDRERKRLRRLAGRLEEDAANLPDAALCRLRGDALKAALHAVPRGAASVTLTAWTEEGARPLEVPLDPRRDPRENMERWYRRARRSERGAAAIADRIEGTRRRLAELEAERERIAAETEPAALRPAEPATPRRRKRRPEGPSGPPRFTSADGHEIVVGRSAEENETVTFRIARGNDTWLHVRDRPGAHVVIRMPPGKSPPLETLLDAATLAVHHGSARGSSGVEVSYTLRKHVRRIRGAPRGTVSIAAERSLRVDPDPERLERLYATRVTAR